MTSSVHTASWWRKLYCIKLSNPLPSPPREHAARSSSATGPPLSSVRVTPAAHEVLARLQALQAQLPACLPIRQQAGPVRAAAPRDRKHGLSLVPKPGPSLALEIQIQIQIQIQIPKPGPSLALGRRALERAPDASPQWRYVPNSQAPRRADRARPRARVPRAAPPRSQPPGRRPDRLERSREQPDAPLPARRPHAPTPRRELAGARAPDERGNREVFRGNQEVIREPAGARAPSRQLPARSARAPSRAPPGGPPPRRRAAR
jgi:hypothetical protein